MFTLLQTRASSKIILSTIGTPKMKYYIIDYGSEQSFFPIIILILNTIPKSINYKLNTMPKKKSSTPPLPKVFKWDSPKAVFSWNEVAMSSCKI